MFDKNNNEKVTEKVSFSTKMRNYFLTKKEKLKQLERKDINEFFINYSLYILLFIFIVVVAIMKPRFLSLSSIVNVITQTSFRLPIALGVAGIIVLTGTDLSAGRIIGLVAVIAASLLQNPDYVDKMYPNLGTVPIILVLLIVIVIGGLIGLFNGFFVAKFKLHPFIVTLSTQLIVYAMSLQYIKFGTNNGKPIGELRSDFTNAVTGNMFTIFGVRIQFLVLYALIATIIMWFVWNKTKIGKNMFAVGSNPEAATVSGISVNKTIMIVFLMAGMLYGLNGFMTSAFVGSNNAATGVNFELDAIAACVIGGVSFSGGVGKIRGVLLGVFLLQLITVSFVFLGIDANLQYAIKGFVILLATAIDMRKYIVRRWQIKKKKRKRNTLLQKVDYMQI
ncbi:Ribose ABC transporter [Haploplasma axanthum]|uniref:Ribose ABC transporter n=2 Tax=Haploplasma axanthum TaxID=29552 RepID=A0A449BBM3_HAPAX|nr:Ribose ABC transporter [Haploplasma axanthum]